VSVHWRATAVDVTVTMYEPLQSTVAGLLPPQRGGVDWREHDDAFVEL
jgi:hypothetical protein